MAVELVRTANNIASATTLTITGFQIPSADNQLLVVAVSVNGGTGSTVNSVSAGSGNALTRLATVDYTTNIKTEIWYRKNPTSGNRTITVTLNASKRMVAGAALFSGVDLDNPFGTVRTGSGSATTTSLSVNGAIGDLIFDAIGVRRGVTTTFYPNASQTQLWRNNQGNTTSGDSGGASTKVATSTTTVMTWNMYSSSVGWAGLGVAIKPAPTIAVTTDPATSISAVGATLNGDLTDMGEESSVDVFFQYREKGDLTWLETEPQELDEPDTFSEPLTGLQWDTEYEFRACVAWGASEEAYGSIRTFTTDALSGYLIERKVESGSWEFLAVVENVLTTQYLDEDIEKDVEYSYRIKRVTSTNESPWSNVASYMIPGIVDIEIPAPVGEVSAEGIAATVAVGVSAIIKAPVGEITAEGIAPAAVTAGESVIITAPVGYADAEGIPADVLTFTGILVRPPPGEVGTEGIAPRVVATSNVAIGAPVGEMMSEGAAADVYHETVVRAPVGEIGTEGIAPTVKTTKNVAVKASVGGIDGEGIAATVHAMRPVYVQAPVGEVGAEGVAPALTAVKNIAPAYRPDRELRAKVFVDQTEYEDRNIASIILDETVNPTDSFAIGTAASAKLELTLADISEDTNLDGAVIKPYLGFMDGSSVVEYIPLGVFHVEEIDWQKDGLITRAALTCFDNMVRLETAYILSSLTYPASLRAVAQEIAQKAGVTFNAASLAALPTTAVPELMGYTLREAIGFIASFVGGYAYFNRAGELDVRKYHDQDVKAKIRPFNCVSFKTSENEFTIGRLTCRVGEGEDGNPLVLVAGITGNEIQFDNPLMTQGQLDTIHTALSQISYMPYELRWQGDPALRAGDMISIADKKGNTYQTYIMEQQLRYVGGLSATAEAKGKTELAQKFQSAGPLTLALSRASSVKAYADRLVQMLADGEFEDGTFIDGNMIVSPIIAGMEGRIAGELKVGGLGSGEFGPSGVGVFDAQGHQRAYLGQHADGFYGLRLKNKAGDVTFDADDDGNLQIAGRFRTIYGDKLVSDLHRDDYGGRLNIYNADGYQLVTIGASRELGTVKGGVLHITKPVDGALQSRVLVAVSGDRGYGVVNVRDDYGIISAELSGGSSTSDHGWLRLWDNDGNLRAIMAAGSSPTEPFGRISLINRYGVQTVWIDSESLNGEAGAIFLTDENGNTVINLNCLSSTHSYINKRVAIGKNTIGTGYVLDVDGNERVSGDLRVNGDYICNGYVGESGTFRAVSNARINSTTKDFQYQYRDITVKGGIITNMGEVSDWVTHGSV